MRVVVSFAVALTLVVYSSAMAAGNSGNTPNNAKTYNTVTTSGSGNTYNGNSNNGNTSGSGNTSNGTWNNGNTSGSSNTSNGSSNNGNMSGNGNTSNGTWNNNNTSGNGNTSNGNSGNTNTSGNANGNTSGNTGGWNGTSNGGNNWNNGNSSHNTGTWSGNTSHNGAGWNNTTNQNGTWNTNNMSTSELLRVSNEGFAAIRAIRAARVAIFNGQPTVATKMLNQARHDLNVAAKDAPSFVAASETTMNGKMVAGTVETGHVNWIPIDGQVSLADTYVVTKERSQHIQKANEYFKNGQSKQAIEELRLAAINVTCTRVMMPLTNTTNWVSEAGRLLGQQKFYEANLALKAAEDGLVVNTASLVEMPQVSTPSTSQSN